jgi:hypothetical protein
MIVVGYYTQGTAYEKDAARLRASLDHWGLAHEIVGVPPQPDWDHATALKPIVLFLLRQALAGPILYVDVDAVVHADCSKYFDGLDCDFAAHWFQGPSGGYDRSRNDDWLLSGTMYFADTGPARDLLLAWCELNCQRQQKGNWTGGGQGNLHELEADGWLAYCLKIVRLPGRYCYIFDKAWAYPEGEPIIIEHLIASRANRDPNKRPENMKRDNATRLERIAELERKEPWLVSGATRS